MPKGTPDDPFTTPAPYPMRGYVFNEDGTHEGGEILFTVEDLHDFIRRTRDDAKAGREIMATDADDYCNLHVSNGHVVFPRTNPDLVSHYED